MARWLGAAGGLVAAVSAQADFGGDLGGDFGGDLGGGFGGGEGFDAPEGISQEMIEQMIMQQEAGMGGGMPDMMGGMGGGGEYFGEPADVKLVLCDTCKAMVAQGAKVVTDLRNSLPNTKISEERIDTLLEDMCNPKEEAGIWLTQLDMVEGADRISLEKHEEQGQCKRECLTLQMACEKVYDEVGSDFVEQLYLAKQSVEQMQDTFCTKMIRKKKGSCGKPYPAIPEGREPDEEFEPKTEMQIAMDEMNRKIRSTPGLGSFNPMQDEL
eukprot:CAMPEP_0184516000 /NCGR_PEP_ID=MMETSP0198_2-20121128/4794_1 /TAXON_ID=1112570 /ORGANISM="Thraustochytrium sp., Strain LLF1b" /LENGTH=268 /DNA_ID=CAMNT_0026906289 /DNA_START=127 /DNA_END=933 /DNA_ORIENTATION=-